MDVLLRFGVTHQDSQHLVHKNVDYFVHSLEPHKFCQTVVCLFGLFSVGVDYIQLLVCFHFSGLKSVQVVTQHDQSRVRQKLLEVSHIVHKTELELCAYPFKVHVMTRCCWLLRC